MEELILGVVATSSAGSSRSCVSGCSWNAAMDGPMAWTTSSSVGPAAQVGYWVFGPEGWIGTVVKV